MKNYIQNNQKFRILIVDDILKNIQVVAGLLQDEGYELAFARNGKSALEMVKKRDFDLVLLDIMMPEMDGFEVCIKLKEDESTKNIPIIFLTAKTESENIVKGFNLGGQDYITKPFYSKELISRVRLHLDVRAQKKSMEQLNRLLEDKVKERTAQLEELNLYLTRANAKLARLDKAKSEFLFIINHELRTPLNGILGFLSLLEQTKQTQEQVSFTDLMKRSVNKLEEMAKMALFITELKIQAYKVQSSSNSLDFFISRIVSTQFEKASEKGIAISYTIDSETDRVPFDVNLITTCLQIVIDNAINHSPRNSKVDVFVKKNENNLVFEIVDSGKGFSMKALHNIFEFFAAEDVMHHSEGLGLGLATAKLIMDTLQGKIEVSNTKNNNASVKLFLPINSK